MSSLFSSRNVIFDESHLARASVEADKEKQEETGGGETAAGRALKIHFLYWVSQFRDVIEVKHVCSFNFRKRRRGNCCRQSIENTFVVTRRFLDLMFYSLRLHVRTYVAPNQTKKS